VTSIAYRKGHEFDLRIAWQWVQLESYGELNQAIIFHVFGVEDTLSKIIKWWP